MIANINGLLLKKSSTEIVVDCNGVGYLLSISVKTSESIPETGNKVSLPCFLIPREDSLNLYGFRDLAEKDLFKLLLSVKDIGPKVAMSILSVLTPPELQELIMSRDVFRLSKVPGIGKTKAERLVVELSNKVAKIDTGAKDSAAPGDRLVAEEAAAALITLGFTRQAAEKAVRTALKDIPGEATAEALIRLSLKYAMV